MKFLSSGPWRACVLAAALGAASLAQAAVTGYTARAGFDAAVAASPAVQVVDFESEAAGTTYAAGTGPAGAGFTLTSVSGGLLPMVGDLFWTTSGTHYLGLEGSDTQFLSGDSVTFTFTQAVHGFGLYAIGGQDLQAGDLQLEAGGASVLNAAHELTDNAGSFAFFLGLVSDGAGFTSATLTGLNPGGTEFFLFAVDDAVLASATTPPIPEPTTVLLMAAGLLALALRRTSMTPRGETR